jgi:hypothetical protein
MSKRKISRGRKAIFYLILIIAPICMAFVIGEVLITIFKPVPYIYPRYKFSPQYGFVLYENTRMVHAWPRNYKFHYTVNEFGYRGKAVDPSDAQSKPNIVILGDSYTFGMGVNDGEQYSAILQMELGESFNVINLATPGWGLTQQIRRYSEFGALYKPIVLVMQYCSNDPEDNLNSMVTTIESGKFKFSNSNAGINRIKKYLSHSIIQKSQIYNLYRGRLFEYFQKKHVGKKQQGLENKIGTGDNAKQGIMAREKFYCDLLELFTRSRQEQGIRIIMIASDKDLKKFENIEICVKNLDSEGTLDYIDIKDWLKDVENHYSPEGHWGVDSHRAIGRGLADLILSGQ